MRRVSTPSSSVEVTVRVEASSRRGGWNGEDPVEVEADLDGCAPPQLVSSDDAAPAGGALAQGEGGQEEGGGSVEGEDAGVLTCRERRRGCGGCGGAGLRRVG